jgi:hypothetical protein
MEHHVTWDHVVLSSRLASTVSVLFADNSLNPSVCLSVKQPSIDDLIEYLPKQPLIKYFPKGSVSNFAAWKIQ